MMAELRRTFIRGILLILPLAITYLVLRWVFGMVTGVGTPIVHRLLTSIHPAIVDNQVYALLIPVLSVLLTLGVVLLIGLVGGNYLGRLIWTRIEAVLLRIPPVSWVYAPARQLMEAFRSSGGGAFKEVVLVEYPRRGVWCLGFITAPVRGLMPRWTGGELVYVFLPTTPNPTSGYTIVVPREDTAVLDMTVDEGLKLIVSGGFIAPVRHGAPGEPPAAGNPGS